MLKTFNGLVDGVEVHLMYEGEERPCYLMTNIVMVGVVRIDEIFDNLIKASAVLRSELGYQDACRVLDSAGVPRSSKLWHLNHDGPPSEG